jgi:hypothetical protein
VDIIPYTDDLVELVVQALKPADVLHVEIAEDYSRAVVNVDEEHLSLAIGRKGLNVRLAARLCGMAINIVNPAQEAREAAEAAAAEAAAAGEAAAEGESAAPETTDGETPEAPAEGEEATTEAAAAEAVATAAEQPEVEAEDTVEAVADPNEKIEDFVVKSPAPEVEAPIEPPVEEEAVAEEPKAPEAGAESVPPQADSDPGPPEAEAEPRPEA